MEYEVALAACPDNAPAACRQALVQALDPIGGLDWVRPGMRIAIKANLVSFLKPEAAATTHPQLLVSLVELLRELGAEVIVGDSPGGLYNLAYVSQVYRATGMLQVERAGAKLNRDFSQATAQYPQAQVAKQFQYTRYLDDVDAIINFSKLKTHAMMGMSNSVKNMFGIIPGTLKPEYHFRYSNPADFARMIVDLGEYFKPVLCITDAVTAMEGNGPTMGTPRQIGAVLASKDAHKLDLVCAGLIGLSRSQVPTLEAAFERGYIPPSWQEVSLYGPFSQLAVQDFKTIKTLGSILFQDASGNPLKKLWGRILQSAMCSYPVVEKDGCVGCGKCRQICPAKAIVMKSGLPAIDRKTCIHCFCCQEFCPKGAMKSHRPAIAKLLNTT